MQMNGDCKMEFVKKQQHIILAFTGILITVCGIALTLFSVSKMKTEKERLVEQSTSVDAR